LRGKAHGGDDRQCGSSSPSDFLSHCVISVRGEENAKFRD
jgi:hypothetical protein